jgi:uncharacterized protein
MSEPTRAFRILRDLAAPMRDGTVLRADVYLPKADGPFPALLERTPYGKEATLEIGVGTHEFFAARGFAVVIQDVRGRYKSEGQFIPLHDDGWGTNRDGYDTVEWIASQPWCNGQVGTFGGSFPGALQNRLAPTRPPHLRAMHIRQAPADFHAEWAYHGGAFELALTLGWTLEDMALGACGDPSCQGKLRAAIRELDSWQRHLPLRPNPLFVGLADWYHDILAHPEDGPFWWQWNTLLHLHEVETPIYHLGSWYDCFLNGTLKSYVGLRTKARTQAAREAQRLMIGPWVHGPFGIGASRHGDVDFGPAAARDYNELRLPWFDYWLKGTQNGVMDEPRVKLFVMGENEWRSADDYPLPGTNHVAWHLRSEQRLTLEAPTGAEPAESYVYDPDDPVPARGGCAAYMPAGAFDQRPIEERCLNYTSEPLDRNLTVIGGVHCILHAMSSAPDTDWVLRLADVHPDGFSRILCDGILRARFRESPAAPVLLRAHQVYEFVVDLWATANTFKSGHRLRVTVTSSCFPRFDRNLNTGGPFGTEARGQIALNTIFHDVMRPSRILLPVVG